MSEFFIKKVCLKTSEVHGTGVFASEGIKKGELIERSPVLVYADDVYKMFQEAAGMMHPQEAYIFYWGPGACAVAWGYASIYNHGNGNRANANFEMIKSDTPSIEICATRDIEPGEEIFIHYDQQVADLEFSETCGWRRIYPDTVSVYKVMFEMEGLWDVDWVEIVEARTKQEAIDKVRQKDPQSFNHRVVHLASNTV